MERGGGGKEGKRERECEQQHIGRQGQCACSSAPPRRRQVPNPQTLDPGSETLESCRTPETLPGPVLPLRLRSGLVLKQCTLLPGCNRDASTPQTSMRPFALVLATLRHLSCAPSPSLCPASPLPSRSSPIALSPLALADAHACASQGWSTVLVCTRRAVRPRDQGRPGTAPTATEAILLYQCFCIKSV
eukprot:164793-Rhodomonas_salina.1